MPKKTLKVFHVMLRMGTLLTDQTFSCLQQPKTFEMKVNLSGTEFVLLDNLDTADTNAVVLKVGVNMCLFMTSSFCCIL